MDCLSGRSAFTDVPSAHDIVMIAIRVCALSVCHMLSYRSSVVQLCQPAICSDIVQRSVPGVLHLT